MSFPNEYGHRERVTDAPISVDLTADAPREAGQMRIPPSWVGMSGYLIAGIFLGLVLILALSVGRGSEAAAAAPAANAVTDSVVHLHSRDIGNSCWQGFDKPSPARLTVALEVGIDGKIRYAAASGETAAMRGCVEAHVKSWEFLPQAQAQTMALPFEVDRR
jgi:hypothetical protein